MFRTAGDFDRADWELLRHGAITLYWRDGRFEAGKADLRALGYRLIEITCATPGQFRRAISDALEWTARFGDEPWDGNLNALNDGFSRFPFGDDADVALCLRDFHVIAGQQPEFAHGVLDIVEDWSRNHLLTGHRLLALVQTSDLNFRCEGLGGRSASWNAAEWLNRAREV
ncbi:MAG: hypothetical protein JNL41_15375 [Phenylobacterium sp.]|uniref:hypothetical protein n=1 Tax=Phenylobacterium sp. TaxID=1871053 RepID=UPI001A461BA4|nr:hypothetical protein [Phenylobacterium sp.]MBL8555653.1 hypothetical protein [Phenylobacterium sp.]